MTGRRTPVILEKTSLVMEVTMKRIAGVISILMISGLAFWGCGSDSANSFSRELNGKTFTVASDKGEAVYHFDRTRIKMEYPDNPKMDTKYLDIERIIDDERKMVVTLPSEKKAHSESGSGKYIPYYVYFWETIENGNVLLIAPPEAKKPNYENALKTKRPEDSDATIVTMKPVEDK